MYSCCARECASLCVVLLLLHSPCIRHRWCDNEKGLSTVAMGPGPVSNHIKPLCHLIHSNRCCGHACFVCFILLIRSFVLDRHACLGGWSWRCDGTLFPHLFSLSSLPSSLLSPTLLFSPLLTSLCLFQVKSDSDGVNVAAAYWSLFPSPVTTDLYGLAMVDYFAYAVGANGTILAHYMAVGGACSCVPAGPCL